MKEKGLGAEKGLRPTSPVHVHVEDDVPVHVHVKQKGKSKVKKAGADNARSGRPRRPTSSARARSKSPGGGPWVPPPGRATKGQKVTWDGPTHRLEINTPRDQLRMEDLSTDEEDKVHGKMKNYERKIDSLMSEVGTLKNEVDLQRTFREIDTKNEMLDVSRHVMEQQEREIDDMKDELTVTERQNRILRRSMEMLDDETAVTRVDREILAVEREKLMKKLIEAEMDGQAAAKQIGELRDAIRRLREENRISAGDFSRINKQKDMLLEKLADFEATNRTLRRLLREQHRAEAAAIRLSEQRDVLMIRLAEADRNNERLHIELGDRDRFIGDLKAQLHAKVEENVALSGLQGSLENTRAHLQKQLRTKEADINRMAVQIRTLESVGAQDKIELDHLQTLLSGAKDKSERDKEALKKATRRLEELESLMDRVEHNTKSHEENMSSQLHDKQSEVSALKVENERLKTSIATIENKFKQADEELLQLRGNLKQYENLVEEYRSQMNQSRREADDTMVRLEETEKATERIKQDGEFELEKVKVRLHQRLQELEPLPEMLKSTELKLHDSHERMMMYERKNSENTKIIAELTAKVEHVTDSLEQMRGKFHDAQDDNRLLNSKIDSIERKLRDSEDQNKELLTNLAKREETIHQNNLRLEEKARENASLTRQLENALSDMRRQAEQSRDKTSQKERTFQTRITDLESQLSQTRAEIARVKREKEENERKFNSRLYDLKDRLEQSHSTNRSMQNYVQFLKNSYANVFGDSATSYPSTPVGLP